MDLFHQLSEQCSKATTEKYSTSFSSAIKLLQKELRPHIFNIYGFVRFADEIVDSFHQHDKATLLAEFKRETFFAIERKISLNPILNSFQLTVHHYNIPHHLITSFFKSMEMDLKKESYSGNDYKEYIYGSAEVVGLMCLIVFCEGNMEMYNHLQPSAQSLGAAFQKVNFLRDVKSDYQQLNRIYFPGVDFKNFSSQMKMEIESDIATDFNNAFIGIVNLPVNSKFAVYVAYKYYLSLFKKIKRTHAGNLLQKRIRIPAYIKAIIVAKASIKGQLNML